MGIHEDHGQAIQRNPPHGIQTRHTWHTWHKWHGAKAIGLWPLLGGKGGLSPHPLEHKSTQRRAPKRRYAKKLSLSLSCQLGSLSLSLGWCPSGQATSCKKVAKSTCIQRHTLPLLKAPLALCLPPFPARLI